MVGLGALKFKCPEDKLFATGFDAGSDEVHIAFFIYAE